MNLTIFPSVAGLLGIFENRLTVILSADVRLIVGVSLERVKEYFLRILEKMTKFLKVNILSENSSKIRISGWNSIFHEVWIFDRIGAIGWNFDSQPKQKIENSLEEPQKNGEILEPVGLIFSTE